MPAHYLAAEEESTGYPCPRREWASPDDPLIYELMLLGSHQGSAHLFRTLFDATFGDEPRAERHRVLRLIFRAHADEAIAAALWPKQG